MSVNKKLVLYTRKSRFYIYKKRAAWRKWQRIWFPSPAEVEFIRIMGGKSIVIDHIRHPRTKFPLTIVTSLGVLERELIEREVRAGAMHVDFGQVTPYGNRGIEVDGKLYHDVVKDMERDDYLAKYGWQVLHINAGDIYRDSARVQRLVIAFLSR